MSSAHVNEAYQELTAKNKLISATRSPLLDSRSITIGLEHKAVNDHSVPSPHHDMSRISDHKISIPNTPVHAIMAYKNCSFSCPASPTAFGKGEADVLNKPQEPSSLTIPTTVKREEEFQHQHDNKPNGTTADTSLISVDDRLRPRFKNTLALSDRILDELSRFRDHHRCSKRSPRFVKSISQAKPPSLRRSQSLDSNMNSKEPECACFVSSKKTAFVYPQSNDDSGRKGIAQTLQELNSVYSFQDQEGLASHTQVPKIVIQEAWNGKEYPFVYSKWIHGIKSEGDKVTMSEAAISCVSHQSICKEISGDQVSTSADAPLSNSQNLLKMLDIGSDLVESKCIGITNKGVRCKFSLSKSTRLEVQRTLRGLIAMGLPKENRKFSDQLELLAYLMLCKNYHQRTQATKVISSWKAKLAHVVSGNVSPHIVEPILPPDISALQSIEIDHKQETQTYPSKDILTTDGAEFTERYVIRTLVPFDPKARSKSSTGDFLRGAIMRDLTKREIINSGVIYIYWFPGNFGHLKIGVTTRAVEERLKEWRKKCGHRPLLVYPDLLVDRQPVPHIFRVEALVHAELRNCRKTEQCKACKTNHKEWFEKSLGDATAAVKKWSAWMRTAPYMEEVISDWDEATETIVSRSNWKFKRELVSRVQHLCEPTRDISRSRPSSSQRDRPQMGRASSDPGARRREPPSRNPSFTRSMATKERSKSKAPDDVTGYPQFSDDFLKAHSIKEDRSSSLSALQIPSIAM